VAPSAARRSRFAAPLNPVDSVSYAEAAQFARDFGLHIPNEATWEFACRGGSRTPFWTGDLLRTTEANFNGVFPYSESPDPRGYSHHKTTEIASFPANPHGLFDTHGNVAEYCESSRHPETGDTVVCRGGGWDCPASSCRSASRWVVDKSATSWSLGFRVYFPLKGNE